MTLKEKFEEYTDQKSWQKENYNAIECEVIADEFAIGFAEWIDSSFYQGDDVNEYHKSITEYREGKIFTVKKLLEIYKNEKGL
jgi:hypothetical protein